MFLEEFIHPFIQEVHQKSLMAFLQEFSGDFFRSPLEIHARGLPEIPQGFFWRFLQKLLQGFFQEFLLGFFLKFLQEFLRKNSRDFFTILGISSRISARDSKVFFLWNFSETPQKLSSNFVKRFLWKFFQCYLRKFLEKLLPRFLQKFLQGFLRNCFCQYIPGVFQRFLLELFQIFLQGFCFQKFFQKLHKNGWKNFWKNLNWRNSQANPWTMVWRDPLKSF